MHKLGIIVPYRNRYEHLAKFHDHLQIYLDKKGIDYTLIIVEQDNASAFNRGMLCNIGFKEAVKRKCDYVVFHDVDMLPIDVDYSYSSHPIHLATDNLPFESYFGGMTLFPSDTFTKINGFSNKYWGWGFEDDDLRYRCIKHNIPLNVITKTLTETDKPTVNLNGVSSFIKLKNELNVLRDFNIKLNIKIGKLILDHTKEADIFPIFTIPGYDFSINYSSFKRFSLQFFDKDNNFHQIYSDIIEEIENEIEVSYDVKKRIIVLTINGKLIGELNLKRPIRNYNNENNIFIGTDGDLNSYFRGTVENLTIVNSGKSILELNSKYIDDYQLKDQSDNENHGKLYNIAIDTPDIPSEQQIHTPHRRKSSIEKLSHKENGFNGGRWESDLTRWNQLRFTNEVLIGVHDSSLDGLSDCKFTLHGRKRDGKFIHLKVGI